jgi:hypothetical protein
MGSQHSLTDTRPGSPLRVNSDVGDALSTNQRGLSVEADARDSDTSPTRRCKSPISRVKCDGWCDYDLIPCATVVSVDSPALAPTNQQRAWEGPRGSLTVVICEFLSKPEPVFRLNLASFVLVRLAEVFAMIRDSNVPCQVRHSPPSYGRL